MARVFIRLTAFFALLTLIGIGGAIIAGKMRDRPVLAYVAPPNEQADIVLLDLQTGLRLRTGVPAAVETNPVWSSDGRALAFLSARDGTLRYYVLESGAPVRAFAATTPLLRFSSVRSAYVTPGRNALWSTDGMSLLFVQVENGQSVLYQAEAGELDPAHLDLDSAEAQAFLAQLSDIRQGYMVAADGRYRLRMAVTDGRWLVLRDDLQTGDVITVYDSGVENRITDYALSANGRYAAISLRLTDLPDITVFDIETGHSQIVSRAGGVRPAWRP